MNTKDSLIKAMQELLWTKGYSNTSPKEIQRASGVGQGSMYHHFKGKSDLARQAILGNAQELQQEITAILAPKIGARARIENYLLRKRAILPGCRMGGLAQDSEIINDDSLRAPIADNFEWLLAELGKVLEEGKASGEFSSTMNSQHTALALVSVMQGAFVIARATQSEEYYKQAMDGIIAMLN